MSGHRYYPVYLDLVGRPVTVVGGGAVAEEKVEGLVAAGARVTVIAPDLCPALEDLRRQGLIAHVPRAYRPGDLAGAMLVLAERIDPDTDRRVFREAEQRGVFANVQDDVPHCSFIAPSIVRRGDLTVAISTSGRAPVLAVRLRQRLEKQLGPEIEPFLRLAAAVREPLARQTPAFEERKRRWYELIDSDVLDLLRDGGDSESGLDAARDRFEEILGVRPVDDAAEPVLRGAA